MKFKNIFFTILILLLCNGIFAEEFYSEKDVLDAKTNTFALYNFSQKDEALIILDKIPKKYMTEEMYIVKANIYEDKGDIRNSYNSLNLALQINPKSYKVYYNLGLLAYKESDINLAIDNFNKSVKYKGDFAYSHYNLSLCYIKLNDYKKAKRELIKAIEIEPNKNFYYNLAYVYKKLNKEKDAKKILDSYNKMN